MMERTRIKRRIWRTGVGTVVLALAVVAIWRVWPRERLLMDVARPVVGAEIQTAEFCWLSLHDLLLVSTEHDASMSKERNGHTAYKNWQGSADILDTTTHSKRHLSALTKLIRQTTPFPLSTPSLFQISPDGSWLLWRTYIGNHGLPSLRVARLDGSHYRGWKRSRVKEWFFLDSSHLVQMMDEEPVMTICDLLNPSKDRQYRKPDQAEAILAQYALQQPVFVTPPDSQFYETSGPASIETYRTEDRMVWLLAIREEKRQAPLPVQTIKVKLPEGATLHWIKVSLQQKSILYHLTISRTPPLFTWLHRILPKLDIKSSETEGIWISRADGSGMREIGHLPRPSAATGNSDELLDYFDWLPDGKQISFVYQGTLYVVPAELGK
jgi:hypothetical protein